MNSTTGMLETRPGPERSTHSGVAISPTPARTVVTSNSLADRVALRLGMALVIWSRQHAARLDARLDVRVGIAARRDETEDRRARQLSADRRDLVGLQR